jgi:phage/plasmid primase-like uncharacterized protein
MAIESTQHIWDCAKPADDSHPFFARWQFNAPGLRVDRSGALLMVPMRDAARNLKNLGFINAEGNLHFLSGGMSGLYYGLTGPKEVIAITQEFVTGVRYHLPTGNAVAIAFSAENVPHVATAMHNKYPTARIILIADFDVVKDRNPVVAFADAAAAIDGEHVALPEPDRENALEPGSDAQKLLEWMRRKGLTDFTRKQVMQLGPNSIRDAMSAKAALRSLVEMGCLVTEDGSRYHVTSTALSAIGEERKRSA